MKHIDQLKDVIRRLHGCQCSHVESVSLSEDFGDQVTWQGTVEVFDLIGHQKARQCYGWRFKRNEGDDQYVTVLRLPPIDSPRKAVQAAIVAEYKRTH